MRSRPVILSGRTELSELIAMLACCDLFLTNDSGPMHLAAALRIPTLAIFGSTDEIATGPMSPAAVVLNKRVECSPCLLRECPIDHRCMKRITVEEVAQQAFRMIDARLEHAATTLGATPWRAFLTVTLPLCIPGIAAGSVLCFSRSLGEFGATMAFVGNIPGETRTLPLAIYSFTHLPDGEMAAARLAILSIALALCALIANHVFTRRAERLLGFEDSHDAYGRR